MGLALVVILTAFLTYTAYLHYLHTKFSHLPRPEPFSFYRGHFSAVYDVVKDGKPYNLLFIDWYYQCGPVFIFYVYHLYVIVFLDPKDAKEILMNPNMYKPVETYEKLEYEFMGKGLLIEPHYEAWKPRRSIYDPSFNKVSACFCEISNLVSETGAADD